MVHLLSALIQHYGLKYLLYNSHLTPQLEHYLQEQIRNEASKTVSTGYEKFSPRMHTVLRKL